MKKLLLLTTSLTAIAMTIVQAQPQKGHWMVGGSLATGSAYVDVAGKAPANFNFSFQPRAGLFLNRKFVLGTGFNIGGGGAPKNFLTVNYGVTPFARYYFFGKDTIKINRLYTFLEAGAGFSGSHSRDMNSNLKYNYNFIKAGFGPGLTYFLTPHVSAEGLLKMNYSTGPLSTNSGQYISPSLEVGFQIYFKSKKEMKSASRKP